MLGFLYFIALLDSAVARIYSGAAQFSMHYYKSYVATEAQNDTPLFRYGKHLPQVPPLTLPLVALVAERFLACQRRPHVCA
jgi:hypothetical protein